MKTILKLTVLTLCVIFLSCVNKKEKKIVEEKYKIGTPEYIVQKQVEAYNAQDIEAFLATYSSKIEVFEYPNTLIFTGLEEMRIRYKKLFEDNPNRRAEIVNRTVLGNFIIDKEKVIGNKDGKEINAVAIYQVEEGLIDKIWFIVENQ